MKFSFREGINVYPRLAGILVFSTVMLATFSPTFTVVEHQKSGLK